MSEQLQLLETTNREFETTRRVLAGHHRGQFSVYWRIVGGKLPAIYGPSADEQP